MPSDADFDNGPDTSLTIPRVSRTAPEGPACLVHIYPPGPNAG